ncbi:MAG: uroporphyrinogen-III C-methyltransferase [Alphaproteobacteria bacterium]|nr:uroporphyrinogen-III C-methyltransferase [Alphaproteobacteria bacterium]MBF0249109.1 uroporphyrinogen-III C-methyltransferase [Alphaproteobacteria bacterium]
MVSIKNSCVYLVGGGPGDPELLTLKALRLIEQADVVVYDRLVGDAVLDLVPTGTARIYVGKAAGDHALPQDEINELLYRLAQSKTHVVRLKGGDPNVFGRGAEEADYLEARGVRVEMVPGVTAAAACSAAARVPLTYRGLASGVRFVTGHRRNDGELDLDWRGLTDTDTTLVIYMGLSTLPLFSAKLMNAGMAPSTPAVLIASGATPNQKVVKATLSTLTQRAEETGLEMPVLTIIGEVASVASVRETPDENALDRKLESGVV